VRTLVISDLHLGAASGKDLLRRAELRAPLIEALREVDRLVVLGDGLELREAPHRAAAELAARLATGPTAAYAAIKSALAGAGTTDLAGALEREADLQAQAGATADHRQATEAFVAKRAPVFTGR